jgi:lysophospholipase L1-like esterase
MALEVLKLAMFLLLLLAPALLARSRFGIARAFGAFGVALILTGSAGMANPFWDILYVKTVLGLSLLAWSAWIQFAPNSWLSFMDVLAKNPVMNGLIIVLLSTVIPFGNLEWLARFTTNLGFIEYHTPMKTQEMSGIADWREHHITSDATREQDPVLFWRSKTGTPPFSAQGFKTPIEMEVPKPANVFRIIAYGDSNTEGPPRWDWSQSIHNLLQSRNTAGRIYEVVNAGVAGYSSYQGIQRFLQEWEIYEPDLIFVSFGWNDIPDALGKSDKAFKPKSAVLVHILRTLIQYRSYLAIQHYVLSGSLRENMQRAQSRVPLPDYLENMNSFAEVGRAQGIEVVFLTRPYRATTAHMVKEPNWRSKVPDYNQALHEFSENQGHQLIDVQKYFENETEGLFGDETHFTEEGGKEMGEFLVRELDLRGLL